MRHTVRWLLSLAMLFGIVSVSGSQAVAHPETPIPDINARLAALPGVVSSREITNSEHPNQRAYEVRFEQLKDHQDPTAGTFQQQVVIHHRGDQLPTLLTPTQHGLSTPTGINFPKNDVWVEQRFFGTSQPSPKDLTKLDIRQAATDLHRVTVALKGIYDRKWLSSGMGVTGQIATYHRRFFPADVQGTYVLGARNDVRNDDDSAYDAFFAQVGTPECRTRIAAFQREALLRRDELVGLYRQQAQLDGLTFELIGSVERAFELSITDYLWKFWELKSERQCRGVPLPSATTADIWNELRWTTTAYFRGDQHLRWDEQNLYLAGTQTGWPKVSTPHLDDLLRYPGINNPRTFVDRGIPLPFDNGAMADIDRWVREESSEMIYIYGKTDPVSAEGFRIDGGGRDSKVYVGTKGGIAFLTPAEQQEITEKLKRWAGVVDQPPATG